MTILEKVKLLLNAKGSSLDELLSFQIEIVSDKVKNYCNREDIPTGLENIIAEMVVDNYKSSGSGDGGSGGNVTSIKRGDTQITYGANSFNMMTGAGGADFIKNYKPQLNRYRKVGTLR